MNKNYGTRKSVPFVNTPYNVKIVFNENKLRLKNVLDDPGLR